MSGRPRGLPWSSRLIAAVPSHWVCSPIPPLEWGCDAALPMETTTQHPVSSASAKTEPPPPLFFMQVGHVRREMQPHRGPLSAGAGRAFRGGQHPAALPWRGLAVPDGWAHQQAGKDRAWHLGRRHHGKHHALHRARTKGRIGWPALFPFFSTSHFLLSAGAAGSNPHHRGGMALRLLL